MDIVVTPDAGHPPYGALTLGTQTFRCVLGRSGISAVKREGDGATPAGHFPLRRVFYRADRLPPPQTPLPVLAISPEDGWCDAPDDPAYNTRVTMPYPASTESMWREDALYDVVVVLGHNDAPVVPGAGSAIFLHVAPADGATAGCIALARSDLIEMLKRVDRTTTIRVERP